MTIGTKDAGSKPLTGLEQAMVQSDLTKLVLTETVPKHTTYTVVDQEA